VPDWGESIRFSFLFPGSLTELKFQLKFRCRDAG